MWKSYDLPFDLLQPRQTHTKNTHTHKVEKLTKQGYLY